MKFSDIPGLTEIKARLIRTAREGKAAHAQLFMGREGALNLPLALAYITYLHCTDRGAADACGQCAACSKSLKYIHPDTHFVFPASNVNPNKDKDSEKELQRFRAEIRKSWRKFLIDQPFGNLADWTSSYGGEDKQAIISREESREIIKALMLKPFESPIKAMLIWLPEHMLPNTANGILKIVEEPPPGTFFVFVTNNPDKLLPTILSRTQQLTVPLLSDHEVEGFLTRAVPDLDAKRRQHIVAQAEGDVRLALTLVDTDEVDHHEKLADWMRACFRRDYEEMLAFANEFHEADRLWQQSFLSHTLTMMRESLLSISGASSLLRTGNGEQKFIEDFSKVLTLEKIERANTLITDACFFLERNGSAKMIFLDLSLQLSKMMLV